MDGSRNPRTLWQSYSSLPRRTRLYFGLAMGLTGGIGLAVADKLQQMFPTDRREADASTTAGPSASPPEKKG